MNKASELFEKVIVNNAEINLSELEANHGKYHVGEANSNIKVEFVLKNKKEIPAQLFKNVEHIKNVKLPSTIESIGAGAFEGSSLTYINIPETVYYIGEGAFSNIEDLPTYIIEKITYINTDAIIEYYSAEEAHTYNYNLAGALQYGAIKTEAVEAVEGVEGVKYTQEEIDQAIIVAEKTTEDWKVEPVEAVEAQEAVLYTNEEIEEHNSELGIWDENTIKDEEIPAVADSWTLNGKTYDEDPTSEEFTGASTIVYDYIYDEDSWNASYQNGALHFYYLMYPFEDLWSETLERNAQITDRRCDFISYSDANGTNEWATGTVQALVYGPWAETNYHKVKVLENSIEGFVGNEYYIAVVEQNGPTLASDIIYELFTDAALTQGTGIYVKITRDYYPGFTQSWEGAVKANGARYPYICVHFNGAEENLQSIITFKYEGKEDVQPWGSSRLFGNGYASDGTTKLKIWGVAALPEEFQDNTFLIPANASAANENWNGEVGEESTFDISKFTLVLEHPGVEFIEGSEAIPATHYNQEEIAEHNAELDIWEEGKVKTEAVEAVEGVEGVKYTQEEIDQAIIVAEKTTEDWKVEPVEAVEAQEAVLYTNEEVDAYNASLEGAVSEGDRKPLNTKEVEVEEEQTSQGNDNSNGDPE